MRSRGDFEYRANEDERRLRRVRSVRWLTTGLPREVLPEDLRRVVNFPGPVFRINAERAGERRRAVSTGGRIWMIDRHAPEPMATA